MPWTTCPLCDSALLIPRRLRIESMLFCPRCDCLLQVISIEPPEVDFPISMSTTSEEPELKKRAGRTPRNR